IMAGINWGIAILTIYFISKVMVKSEIHDDLRLDIQPPIEVSLNKENSG
ncbi:uncharacterized protein METZ01_LOCUS371968, partial [marine metagenome]